jgi:hypothetical protein
MSAKIGSNNIGEIRFGNTRIAKVYFGNTLVYDKPYIKIRFYFDRTNINPRGKLGTRAKACGAEWLSTSDPHVWEVITPLYTQGAGTFDPLLGLGKLFVGDGDENGLLLQTSVGTCQVLEITGDTDKIETLDRLFQKCTAITSVSTTGFYNKFANSTTLVNVNSICNKATNITDGSSLAGYNILKNVATITTHAATFKDADSTANLAQIPVGWGGTYAPPATVLAIVKYNDAGWTINISDPNCPDFSTITRLRVFTTSSISKFEGVNMKKVNIWNKANGFVTSTSTYYYPCFFQGTGTWPTNGTVKYYPTWIFCPDNYNGMLTASQTAGDMPGTLDETLLGDFTCKYGTFDSTKQVYFGFLVLNDPADLIGFDPNNEFAIHSNSNFWNCNLSWYEPS